LDTSLLKRIYEQSGLTCDCGPEEETFISRDLVRVRNGAAQGEFVPVERKDAINARDMVFALLIKFAGLLFDAYLKERFLRPEFCTPKRE
jgi:hypothetical protein